jgi:hypothetical protein
MFEQKSNGKLLRAWNSVHNVFLPSKFSCFACFLGSTHHDIEIFFDLYGNFHLKQLNMVQLTYTVKTGVLFRHLLRHRNSASESVISTLNGVCLSVKTTLLSVTLQFY